jgi:hypothetical protein
LRAAIGDKRKEGRLRRLRGAMGFNLGLSERADFTPVVRLAVMVIVRGRVMTQSSRGNRLKPGRPCRTVAAFIHLAMIRIMLKRLAANPSA